MSRLDLPTAFHATAPLRLDFAGYRVFPVFEARPLVVRRDGLREDGAHEVRMLARGLRERHVEDARRVLEEAQAAGPQAAAEAEAAGEEGQ